jgi:hypothetical protein
LQTHGQGSSSSKQNKKGLKTEVHSVFLIFTSWTVEKKIIVANKVITIHNTVVVYGTITAQSKDLFGCITISIHSSTAVA